MSTRKIVIEGETSDGKKFRPSDWAERLVGNLYTVKNHRIVYNPMICAQMNEKGNKCVVIDDALQNSNPGMFQHLMDFAKHNNLKVCNPE